MVGAPAVWAAVRQARTAEVVDLLRAAATAHTKTSYEGTVLWNGGRWGKPVRVRHDSVSGRTAYRFGRFREFVVAAPSSRMPDPAAWCVDLEALTRNYRARELKSAEFLGRAVRVLRAVPRHPGRPSMEIWVDRASGLPLKVSTFRSDGSAYRVAKFRSIRFGPQEVREVNLQRAHKFIGTPVSLENPQAAAGFLPLLPDYLPEGFKLVGARVKQMATPILTLVYSDGVTAFDLKQWPRPTPAVLEDFYAKGPWGERWSRRMMRWHMRKAKKMLLESEGDGQVTAVCHERGYHTSCDLRVEDLSVSLVARSDLDKAEILKVLRSLHR
jgi:negative regulator of sigma E activity